MAVSCQQPGILSEEQPQISPDLHSLGYLTFDHLLLPAGASLGQMLVPFGSCFLTLLAAAGAASGWWRCRDDRWVGGGAVLVRTYRGETVF